MTNNVPLYPMPVKGEQIWDLLINKSSEYQQGFWDAVNLTEKTKLAFLESLEVSDYRFIADAQGQVTVQVQGTGCWWQPYD